MRKETSSRDKMLEAAARLFGEFGFDATTTREIAERSGVNKAMIHYHFKGKEALLDSLLERYYNELASTLQQAGQGNGSLRDRMHRLVDTYVDFLAENQDFSRIVQREASGGKHVGLVRQRLLPIFRLGQSWLHETFPNTRTGEMAATQLFVSFYGMVVTYLTYRGVLEHLLGSDPLAPENLALRKAHLHRMLDLVLTELEHSPLED